MEYLPTSLGDFWGFNVGKYSSTMVRIWDGEIQAFQTELHLRIALQTSPDWPAWACTGQMGRPMFAKM